VLTILMPTQNRAPSLRRALRFYEDEKLPYRIVLADSSGSEMKAEVKRLVRASSLNIELHDYTLGFSPFRKFGNALSSIDTEYVVMIADDDFIFPGALMDCVEFLKGNPDYSAANGRGYLFSIAETGVYGPISSLEIYPQKGIEGDCPEHRFKTHMRNWTTTAYSVQRTRNLKDIIAVHNRLGEDVRAMELHWYATNVIRGKVAKLDVAYIFRQKNNDKEWRCDPFSEWTSQAYFRKHMDILANELADELGASNKRSSQENRELCVAEINRWLRERRPFQLAYAFDFSINYYWHKVEQKILKKNSRIDGDSEAISRIKHYAAAPGSYQSSRAKRLQ